MISEIGMLIRSAAKPPINPPNTQEFNVFAKIRTTADAMISTNASAATLMNTVPFLLCPTMMRFWNTLIYFTTNLSVEYSRLSGFLQEDFEAREVKDTLQHKRTGEEEKIDSSPRCAVFYDRIRQNRSTSHGKRVAGRLRGITLSEDSDHFPLNLPLLIPLRFGNKDGIHGRIGGLQAHAVLLFFLVEAFQRRAAIALH